MEGGGGEGDRADLMLSWNPCSGFRSGGHMTNLKHAALRCLSNAPRPAGRVTEFATRLHIGSLSLLAFHNVLCDDSLSVIIMMQV